MNLRLSAEEFIDMCHVTIPAIKLAIVDNHVFVLADNQWSKVPFGYVGYNRPVKKWPECPVLGGPVQRINCPCQFEECAFNEGRNDA